MWHELQHFIGDILIGDMLGYYCLSLLCFLQLLRKADNYVISSGHGSVISTGMRQWNTSVSLCSLLESYFLEVVEATVIVVFCWWG